jgi:hypothetical protein
MCCARSRSLTSVISLAIAPGGKANGTRCAPLDGGCADGASVGGVLMRRIGRGTGMRTTTPLTV